MEHYIKSKEKEMIDLLETLVNIDSGSYVKKGIDKIGKMLVSEYKELGFRTEIIEEQERGNHIILRHQEADNPKIMIVAHMDTVFPKGTVKSRPFRMEGHFAYGPGVVDMKGSLVSVLYAIKALHHAGNEGYKNVEIILNSDEEIGSTSSRKLIEQTANNKEYSLIVEPGRRDGSIVSARKGGGRYTLKVKGVAAHAGVEHEKGRSAIAELAYKTIKLHELTKYQEGITVNVGMIEGGTSVNTVASTAIAGVDVRIAKMEQAPLLDKKIREICSVSDIEGTEIEVKGKINRPPMEKTKGSIKLLKIVQEAGAEAGINIKDTYTGGGSDGAFTSALGIPTMDGLGPVGGFAHSKEEYLDLDTFVERTFMLATIISKLTASQHAAHLSHADIV
ncbi:M20 family metallopeptidase [Niallia sp. 01092]|uniref:M20 family metallopeptidase n=1 Tax=unclassified Niallia TaxID=2837522 RepID=UPI003FD28F42